MNTTEKPTRAADLKNILLGITISVAIVFSTSLVHVTVTALAHHIRSRNRISYLALVGDESSSSPSRIGQKIEYINLSGIARWKSRS
jgi:hypothetical protein